MSLHLYGRYGWNVQSCCCGNVSTVDSSSSCRKDIEPTKIKDLNLDREDFAQGGKTKRPLVASPKKKFNPWPNRMKNHYHWLLLHQLLKKIVPNRKLFTVVPKPKIEFVREFITNWAGETDVEVTSMESLIKVSKTKVEFLETLDLLSIRKIRQIKLCTRGQCCNEQWYLCRKGAITASKSHELIIKMKKFRKRGRGVVERKKILKWNLSIQTSQL